MGHFAPWRQVIALGYLLDGLVPRLAVVVSCIIKGEFSRTTLGAKTERNSKKVVKSNGAQWNFEEEDILQVTRSRDAMPFDEGYGSDVCIVPRILRA